MLAPLTHPPDNPGVQELPPFDAVLLVSFGGPEGPADVMPFLENVVRGKNVPHERLLEVAHHYEIVGGVSPIQAQSRQLRKGLQEELSVNGIELPVYWGNRNWTPYIKDALTEMHADGRKRVLAVVTSGFSSFSGCRQYLDAIETAASEVEGAPIVEKVRVWYNHPLFIEAQIGLATEALESLPQAKRRTARLIFTAHSIPVAMANGCDYVAQLEEAARLVAEGLERSDWQLVFQSRSGPPTAAWIEPDVLEHVTALAAIGVEDIAVVPLGFVSDHMEVVYDLDVELQGLCRELGIGYVRAPAVSEHPRFVQMLRQLIEERLGKRDRISLGRYGASHDLCPADCCRVRLPSRPPERASSRPLAVRPPADLPPTDVDG